MIVNNSPGIIIVASKAANNTFLPLNSSLANANAVKTVITNDKSVDTIPTYIVFKNNVPKRAVWNAFLAGGGAFSWDLSLKTTVFFF